MCECPCSYPTAVFFILAQSRRSVKRKTWRSLRVPSDTSTRKPSFTSWRTCQRHKTPTVSSCGLVRAETHRTCALLENRGTTEVTDLPAVTQFITGTVQLEHKKYWQSKSNIYFKKNVMKKSEIMYLIHKYSWSTHTPMWMMSSSNSHR